jgi:hypothetical protein
MSPNSEVAVGISDCVEEFLFCISIVNYKTDFVSNKWLVIEFGPFTWNRRVARVFYGWVSCSTDARGMLFYSISHFSCRK